MRTKTSKREYTRQLGLQEYVGLLVVAFMLIAGFVLAVLGYRMVERITIAGIHDTIGDMNTIIKNEIELTVERPVQTVLGAMNKSPITERETLEERLVYLPTIASILENNPSMGDFYIAYENGDFFGVLVVRTEDDRRIIAMPPSARYIVVHHERMGEIEDNEYLLYDYSLTFVSRSPDDPAFNFDPRETAWFQMAMQVDGVVENPAYTRHIPNRYSLTFSQRAANGRAVVGTDINLHKFSETLKNVLPTPNSRLCVFREDGTVLAATYHPAAKSGGSDILRLHESTDTMPVASWAWQVYVQGIRGRALHFNDGKRDWEVSLDDLEFDGGVKNGLFLAVPSDDLLAQSRLFLRYAAMGMLGVLIFCVPLIWFAARQVSRPLSFLTQKMANIHGFFLGSGTRSNSRLLEIRRLAECMDQVQENVQKILGVINHIGCDNDIARLMTHVLRDTVTVSGADGGRVILSNDKGGYESERYYFWKGGDAKTVSVLPGDADDPALMNVSTEAASRKQAYQHSIARGDAFAKTGVISPGFADAGVLRIDEVAVALHSRAGDFQGILVLCKFAKDDAVSFPRSQLAFMETIASAVSIVLETQYLIEAQRDLRNGFIKMVAGAIDAKSPYTGGHCERVPVIFQMLLQAACDAQEGPLADFSLTDDEWEEALLAGWLHDCGKVTTPEYVVDKATKLETICNRIHEIRTRFEVLKRDAEIAALRAVLAGADPDEEKRKLEAAWRNLDDEFAFVAFCNIGGESMNENDLARLEAIGGHTWTRTLDKRLGVSRDERSRMDRGGVPDTVPARERLLMDGPEHIIPRTERDFLPTDNPWGFKGTPPAVLYNRGELHNLRIRQGTLTEEERYIINDHIRRTIIMLESMPWPRNLCNMPKIVAAHHETMDGRGYPRGLRAEDMEWTARMMAIADIFEALTASDRPYKESKTLSEALKIMDGFMRTHHIDPDLYDLFIHADIPRRYATKYLKPGQLDL